METNKFFNSECIQNISLGIPYLKENVYSLNSDWNLIFKILDRYVINEYPLTVNSDKFKIHIEWLEKYAYDLLEDFTLEHIENMKTIFYKNKISLIAFLGVGPQSDSYPIHKDKMDVLLMQRSNSISLSLCNGPEENHTMCETVMKPGDMVWIPRGTYHRIKPSGNRITFSFGVEGDPNPITYI